MGDEYDLERFVQAQTNSYPAALAEIKAGRKRSHWMWYIFPQIAGLGFSPMSQRYAIGSIAEARAYLAHPLLGARLIGCVEALLALEGPSAHEVFGTPDDWKLRSCATLFAHVSPADSVFHRLIDVYFAGQPDAKTLRLLGLTPGQT